MKAFYFTHSNRLGYGDNRKVKVGITHKVDGKPMLCERGLHASKRLIDALKYAPGHWLYLVEMGGKIVEGNDKCVANERKYIARFNAEKVLSQFARKQALINIEKVKPYCTADEYTLILNWLNTGDKKIRSAAESVAWSAAKSAANSAAESVAWSAAESVAWSAAKSAAESVAWSAANSAKSTRSTRSAWSAWSVAWSAANSAKSAEKSAAESVAWSAEKSAKSAWSAWSAAESAANSAANDMLTDMVRDATGWDI